MKIRTPLRSAALTAAGLVMAAGLAAFAPTASAGAAETTAAQAHPRPCPYGTYWDRYLHRCIRAHHHGHHHGHHGHHHGHHGHHGHHHGYDQ
ncbi:hypothetical protein [Actinomadura opuntiae]|uniref:hypothetical protein n=1 Tax=Actinomadura sp. OS1-43 TaxID=604315 RepID=UPI00255AFE97|nr:hypothetical protein [Actinomadura sp. OS1-43]MDL4818312.1 hypothetical protein [Actinomadura sp. OS1-43]